MQPSGGLFGTTLVDLQEKLQRRDRPTGTSTRETLQSLVESRPSLTAFAHYSEPQQGVQIVGAPVIAPTSPMQHSPPGRPRSATIPEELTRTNGLDAAGMNGGASVVPSAGAAAGAAAIAARANRRMSTVARTTTSPAAMHPDTPHGRPNPKLLPADFVVFATGYQKRYT